MHQFLQDKSSIRAWLKEYHVTKYRLVPSKQYGFKVNVEGDVYLHEKNLNIIPVKFNKVSGNFSCLKNNLTSLEFCPTYLGGNLMCSFNQLTSLEHCPKCVGNFYCNNNKLTSLEFCPESVGGYFNCSNNDLSNLEFCPKEIRGDFICHSNPKLGSTQQIKDFNKIKKIHEIDHRNAQIIKSYNKLDATLKSKEPNGNLIKI